MNEHFCFSNHPTFSPFFPFIILNYVSIEYHGLTMQKSNLDVLCIIMPLIWNIFLKKCPLASPWISRMFGCCLTHNILNCISSLFESCFVWVTYFNLILIKFSKLHKTNLNIMYILFLPIPWLIIDAIFFKLFDVQWQQMFCL